MLVNYPSGERYYSLAARGSRARISRDKSAVVVGWSNHGDKSWPTREDGNQMVSRLDKLGVRRYSRVDVLDLPEDDLLEELTQAAANVSLGPRRGSDLVLLGVEGQENLAAVRTVSRIMQGDSALWVVYPKTGADVTEDDVRAAGRDQGLEAVDATEFSERLAAVKFVISYEEAMSWQ